MIYINALLIAVVSVVFSHVLMDEDMILGWYARLLKRLPEKLRFLLGECPYCFGGQLALWWYVFTQEYKVVEHIFFVSVTIYLIHLIKFLYERTQGN